MVERYLGQALPSTLTNPLRGLFDKATRTLELQKKSPAAHWPDKVAVVLAAQPLISPAIDPVVLQAVHEAVIEGRRLKVKYRDPRSEQDQTLILHPHGLIQREPRKTGY